MIGRARRPQRHLLLTRLVLLCGLLLTQAAGAATTIRYLLFTGDRRAAGEQVVERGDDGWVKVRYIFKDNGRGPELEDRFRLAADGTLAEFHVTGSAEMGGPIDERFVREGDQVRWTQPRSAGPQAALPVRSTCHATVRGRLRPPPLVPLRPGLMAHCRCCPREP